LKGSVAGLKTFKVEESDEAEVYGKLLLTILVYERRRGQE
jgi:hypothetical protein